MRQQTQSASPFEVSIGFSRAVRVGSHILVSGTAPIGADGHTVEGDVAAQARRCLEIILDSIRSLGGSAADVVRTRVYLTRAEDWAEVGGVHGEFFREVRPAATMVVVKALLDPAWRVEMEADAILAT